MSEKLKVRISGKHDELTVNSFLEVIESSYNLLTHLSDKSVTWVVGEISHNSPVSFEFVGTDGGAAAAAIHRLRGGMTALRKKADPHNFFDNKAQKLARKVSTYLTNGVTDVSFVLGDESLDVPADVSYLDAPVETEPYFAFTEIEGVFEKLDLHGSHKRFSIYNRLNGHQTICDFSDANVSLEDLLEHVTRRLRVTGMVKFDSNHLPIRIKVATFGPVGKAVNLDALHKAKFHLGGELTAAQIIANLRGMDA